jgi:hypothetical protein
MDSNTLTARAAAEKYKPNKTHVLFVAESPPQSSDRYFYFENVKRHDWLWIALMKALYPSEWGYAAQERPRKPQWLTKFQNSGFRLVDAVKEPISGSHRRRVALIKAAAPALIAEIRAIAPDRIVLIKKSVHEALCQQFREAGLPVVNEEMLPFPAAGQQRSFQIGFCRMVSSRRL